MLEDGTPNLQLRKILVAVYINAGMAEKAWDELSPAIDDLFEEEKWADAMELFKLFKEVEVAEVRARIAVMYKERGNIAAAVCEFKETARLFREKGDIDNELRSYQDAIELAPRDEEILEGIEALQGRCEKDMFGKLGDEALPGPEEMDAVREEKTVPGIPDNIKEDKSEVIKSGPVKDTAVIEETPDLKEKEAAFRPDETGPVLKEGRGFAVPGVVEKKMREAEFYEHYGFVNEVVNVYEELLNLSPGDKELTERLKLLKSSHEIKNSSGERTAQGEHVYGICYKGAESITNDFYEANGQDVSENPETHYELGFAYIEMGLVEDAINEFRVASNDSLLKIRCCRVIARCYADGGKYREAIHEFKKIVSELTYDGEECTDIKYDLADIYVKNSEYDNALKLYDEIQSQDPGYRDVAAKIKEVKSLTISSA
jgi:tetratricopeptide (TPR) repeat protein